MRQSGESDEAIQVAFQPTFTGRQRWQKSFLPTHSGGAQYRSTSLTRTEWWWTFRLRMIILSAPLLIVTSLVMYQRLYQGKEQKKIAGNDNPLRYTLGQQHERR